MMHRQVWYAAILDEPLRASAMSYLSRGGFITKYINKIIIYELKNEPLRV